MVMELCTCNTLARRGLNWARKRDCPEPRRRCRPPQLLTHRRQQWRTMAAPLSARARRTAPRSARHARPLPLRSLLHAGLPQDCSQHALRDWPDVPPWQLSAEGASLRSLRQLPETAAVTRSQRVPTLRRPPQERVRVGVIGGGAWGTALARHCAHMGHDTQLWAREPEVVAGVNDPAVKENTTYLKVP